MFTFLNLSFIATVVVVQLSLLGYSSDEQLQIKKELYQKEKKIRKQCYHKTLQYLIWRNSSLETMHQRNDLIPTSRISELLQSTLNLCLAVVNDEFDIFGSFIFHFGRVPNLLKWVWSYRVELEDGLVGGVFCLYHTAIKVTKTNMFEILNDHFPSGIFSPQIMNLQLTENKLNKKSEYS